MNYNVDLILLVFLSASAVLLAGNALLDQPEQLLLTFVVLIAALTSTYNVSVTHGRDQVYSGVVQCQYSKADSLTIDCDYRANPTFNENK